MLEATDTHLLIQDGKVESSDSRTYRQKQRTATWVGFLYNETGQSHEAALKDIFKRLEDGVSISDVTIGLRGSFLLVIENEATKTAYVLVDESAMYSAYWHKEGASNSFLTLCQAVKASSKNFSRAKMLEFLQYGTIHSGDTLSPDVLKIQGEDIIEIRDGLSTRVSKNIAKISTPPENTDIFEASAPFCTALKKEKVSLDLTGGLDTRMVAALLLAHDVKFETALTGADGHEDHVIGQEVADFLDVPYYYLAYHGQRIEEDLESVLQRMDGLGCTVLSGHRIGLMQQGRVERGMSIALTGMGALLYKDFLWNQDFPFYRNKKTNMSRLFRMRMEHELLSTSFLSEDAFTTYNQMKTDIRQHMTQNYEGEYNTQSYDNYAFYERNAMYNRDASSLAIPSLTVYSPLGELSLSRIGYQANRGKRFYDRIHREIITSASYDLAKIQTTSGKSCSSLKRDLMLDFPEYVNTKLNRLWKKSIQLVFNKTVKDGLLTDTHHFSVMTSSKIGQGALETLKERGVLREDVSYSDISTRFHQHLVTLGWTLRKLQ